MAPGSTKTEFKSIFRFELPFKENCGGVVSPTIILLVTESAELPALSLTLYVKA